MAKVMPGSQPARFKPARKTKSPKTRKRNRTPRKTSGR
jgi:hypothetical protein